MIEIKLVELNRGRDYIRYEIIKNGSRFITGWLRFGDIKKLKHNLCGKGHYGPIYYKRTDPNYVKPSDDEIAIRRNINSHWGFYISAEGCEIIKNHIKIMYSFLFRGDA